MMSSSFGGWSTSEAHSWVIDDVCEEEDPAEMLARAWEEEALLGLAPGLALSSPGDVVAHLGTRGVARLGGVLSEGTTAPLREDVLRQLDSVRGADAESLGEGQRQSPLSAVLSSSAEPEANLVTRWDLRLRLTPIVRRAVREALSCAALASALSAAAGPDAELWECAALISAPGAAPQPLHADTLWEKDGVLFSTFIALQAVTPAMGPTRFLRGSHTLEAHDVFDDDGLSFVSAASDSAVAGLLLPGEATVYDGRVIHCGGPNSSDELRVMFYLTFRRGAADGQELGNDEAHSIHARYRGRFNLGQLVGGSRVKSRES